MKNLGRLRSSLSMAVAVSSVAHLVATGAEAFCGPGVPSSILSSNQRSQNRRVLNSSPYLYQRSLGSSLRNSNSFSGRATRCGRPWTTAVSADDPSQAPPSLEERNKSVGRAKLRQAGHRRPRGMAPLQSSDSQIGSSVDHDETGHGRRASLVSSSSTSGNYAELQRPEENLKLPSSSDHQGNMPFGHITDETLDLIRASISITEVIGE